LSFPTPGYTLALDFPRRPGIEKLYQRLCAITLDAGGRVYLAKDALLDALSFRRMYPNLAVFPKCWPRLTLGCACSPTWRAGCACGMRHERGANLADPGRLERHRPRLRARSGRTWCDVILAGRDLADLGRTAADIEISMGRSATVRNFDALDMAGHAALAADLASLPGTLNIALMFGTMPDQADMDANPDLALSCITSSFTGAVSVLHRLAPLLEARGAAPLSASARWPVIAAG